MVDARAATDPGDLSDTRRLAVLLTAAEAYPKLETLFLAAERRISGSFLVFDLTTELRSPEARRIGRTWFDLVVHTLRRGVAIDMVISDVDPLMRPVMHRAAWQSVRLFRAAAEAAGPAAQLEAVAARHGALTGALPGLLLAPVILYRQYRIAGWLNRLSPAERADALRDMPGVAAAMLGDASGRVRPRHWPLPRLVPGTHHQKLAVIDGRILFVGGLDLDERRFDNPSHDRPTEETWHDVQVVLTGAPADAAQAHLDSFRAVTAGRAAPPPQGGLLRTLSRQRGRRGWWHLGPEPVLTELADAHLAAIPQARHLIYIETQYFRDRHLARALSEAGKANPGLSLILILPGAPDELAFDRKTGIDVRAGEWLQARALKQLHHAFGRRLLVAGPAQQRRLSTEHPLFRDRLHGAPIIYVHSKVSVFDDRTAIVSSANLNGRSLKWDTEAGVQISDLPSVAALRHRLMAHWLPPDAGPEFFAPDQAVAHWRALARANARAAPEDRRGFIVPYDMRAPARDGRAVPLLPEELV